jgi:hypothetical protein
MKKTLIALAALGVVGAASAQVSISGSIAFGIQNTMADSTAKFHMTDADINFSGKEDLGGGMSVSAATSISNEGLRNGGDTSPNNTRINISGGFGSVTYMNILSGAAKMGGASAEDDLSDVLGGYSTLNVFNYTTPEVMPGLKVGLEWGAADSADMAASGSPYIIGYYNAGPLNVYVDNGGGTAAGWDLRVKYDLGAANVAVRTSKDKYTEFGVTVPMGAVTYGFNTVSHKTTGNKGSSISAAYALSKQTSMTFGYVSSAQKNGGTGGNNYRLQLVKAF